MRRISRPASSGRAGQGRTIGIVAGIAFILLLIVVVASIVQPNLFQFGHASNQSLFQSLTKLGGFVPE